MQNSLTGTEYNACNQVYRDLSEQQAKMLAATLDLLREHGDPLSVMAYGCGFGVFERAFIEAAPVEAVSFIGVDVNQSALERLDTHLRADPRVVGFSLHRSDLVDDVLAGPASVGLSIHSLYRISYDDMTKVVQRMCDRHGQTIVAIDPRTTFWAPFIERMAHEGVAPLFAEDLEACLAEASIPATKVNIDSRVVVEDVGDVETLRKLMSFLTYTAIPRTTRLDALVRIAEGMGGVLTGSRLVIPNPSVVFSFTA